MIKHGKAILSDDLKDEMFVCDVVKCKGACCVEGDLGAPLEENELKIIEEVFDEVSPYLTEEGRAAIEKEGKYILDGEGDYSTTTINGKECAYAFYDERGILKCSFENAYFDKKIGFRKPISCHLYPIRISKYDDYDALNYDRWYICNDACIKGEEEGVPIYKFTKEALIRKYGKEWYDGLVDKIEY